MSSRKVSIPQYLVVTEYAEDGTEYHSIADSDDYTVVPWVDSFEAACAIAKLLDMGNIWMNPEGELVVLAESNGDPINFWEEDEEEDDTSNDDGPDSDADIDADDTGYVRSTVPSIPDVEVKEG